MDTGLLDINGQEKGRLSILEKLQIYENETIINIKQLKTEMMNSIENSSSDISAELKLLKESSSLTGKSLSEVLIFVSSNPQYDDRLFIELQVQYLKFQAQTWGEHDCV